jgi:hypothetical protein
VYTDSSSAVVYATQVLVGIHVCKFGQQLVNCAMVMMVHEERISISIDYEFSNVLTVVDDVLNHSYPTTKFTISTLLGQVVGFITSSWTLSNSYPQCGCQK